MSRPTLRDQSLPSLAKPLQKACFPRDQCWPISSSQDPYRSCILPLQFTGCPLHLFPYLLFLVELSTAPPAWEARYRNSLLRGLSSYCCVGSTCTSIFVSSPWRSVLAVRCRFAGSSGWSSNLLDFVTTICSSALEPFSTPCVGCVLNPLLSGGNLRGKFSCRKAGHDQMLQQSSDRYLQKGIKKCCHIFTIIHPWLWLVSAFVARLANLKHPGSRHKSSMYRLQCPNSDLQKWTWLVHQFDSIKFKASNKSNSRSICIPVAIPVLWCLEWNWSRAYKDFVVHNLLLVLK